MWRACLRTRRGMWRLRHAGALAWRCGPVRACTGVCWCRRISAYIKLHALAAVRLGTYPPPPPPPPLPTLLHPETDAIRWEQWCVLTSFNQSIKGPHEATHGPRRSHIPAPPQGGQTLHHKVMQAWGGYERVATALVCEIRLFSNNL